MAINSTQGVSQTHAVIGGHSSNVEKSGADPQVFKQVSAYKGSSHADGGRVEAAKHEAQVKVATEQLNDFMKRYSIELNFSIDSDSKEVVVKVLNKATGEVIRQIPSEEALKLSKAMDTLQGMIIRAKA